MDGTFFLINQKIPTFFQNCSLRLEITSARLLLLMDGQELDPLKLTTRDFRYDTLYQVLRDGSYAEIFPENEEWRISTISVYLNELRDWKVGQKFRTRLKNGDQVMKFDFISDDNSEKMKISINCSGKIRVKILSVTLCAKWQSVATVANINFDKRGRHVKKKNHRNIFLFHIKSRSYPQRMAQWLYCMI